MQIITYRQQPTSIRIPALNRNYLHFFSKITYFKKAAVLFTSLVYRVLNPYIYNILTKIL